MAMNSELKARWVAALRSGMYKQGRLQLRRDDEGYPQYCCLGVLCVVADRHFSPTNSYLSSSLGKAAGLDKTVQAELARMNDQEHRNFAQIADYIEKEL